MNPIQTEHKPPVADAQPTMFARMSGVVRMTGLGRSTIYRLMAEDKFPSPVRLAKRAVACTESALPDVALHALAGEIQTGLIGRLRSEQHLGQQLKVGGIHGSHAARRWPLRELGISLYIHPV